MTFQNSFFDTVFHILHTILNLKKKDVKQKCKKEGFHVRNSDKNIT